MTNDRLLLLIIKRLKDQMDPGETLELNRWADLRLGNRQFLERMTNEQLLENEITQYKMIDPAKGYARWMARMRGARRSRIKRVLGWSVAAAVILVVAVFGLARKRLGEKRSLLPIATATTDIAPGKSTATLTLGNGQKLILDSAVIGAIAVQGGAKLTKPDSRSLAYSMSSTADSVVYNILATPRAGEFKLTLPDGTQVWLNNASSLRYPSAFVGESRVVELTGEAYFEVATNPSQPFRVKVSNGLSVLVLGTGFNISAYADDPDVRTTLVQGKIKVENGSRDAVLQPGQQVVAVENGQWNVLKSVNTEEITDWRFGLFNFDHSDLRSVLRQLARWYDVDVEFHGEVPDKKIQGQIHRDLTLNQVLEILKDKDVQFTIQGRKLIVTP